MRAAFTFTPIGVIRSCFKEKFGIPRQAGLVKGLLSVLEILPPYDRDEAFRGLEDFSHVWVLFVFHANLAASWKPTVRPPRLGGNRQVGVFASRSPFRPNPIGLSAVALRGVRRDGGRLYLELEGGDFLDGTPVLDIKPYVPYADRIDGARAGYATAPPTTDGTLSFSEAAHRDCLRHGERLGVDLEALLGQILAADPRPAYRPRSHDDKLFAMKIFDLDVKWKVSDGMTQILQLSWLAKDKP